MAQVDRLRSLEREVPVQARSVADPLLQSSLFSFSSEDLEKIRSLSTEWRKESLTQIKLSFEERSTQ